MVAKSASPTTRARAWTESSPVVGSQVEERVLFRFEPDVFRVKYRIKKCEISPEGVRVLNSVGKETLYYAFGSE